MIDLSDLEARLEEACDKLSDAELLEFFEGRSNLSPSTMARLKRVFREVFDDYVDDDLWD